MNPLRENMHRQSASETLERAIQYLEESLNNIYEVSEETKDFLREMVGDYRMNMVLQTTNYIRNRLTPPAVNLATALLKLKKLLQTMKLPGDLNDLESRETP